MVARPPEDEQPVRERGPVERVWPPPPALRALVPQWSSWDDETGPGRSERELEQHDENAEKNKYTSV
jgi:hypothetical protein